ncbi:hypothetical protein SLOPH_2212 [Spraguea lophii 42_110]|uniref:Non-structural maintenance of chromosomes element 4 n=1 Tax=Spraguea lophii (strain 42_110) TaxID=1358809 RepID=S7XQ94_SPRLO|nr:hypothetical protein SLOPH_2212 [Spraguea lophii 42_110]
MQNNEDSIYAKYIQIYTELHIKKDDMIEDNTILDDIISRTNKLFHSIEDTNLLKMDAKISTESTKRSSVQFQMNHRNKKININQLLKDFDTNKINRYINNIQYIGMYLYEPTSIKYVIKTERQKKVKETFNLNNSISSTLLTERKTEKDNTKHIIAKIEHILKERKKINFYQLVLDKESYSKTIENMFYLSFVLKSNKATLSFENEECYILDNIEEDINSHCIIDMEWSEYEALKRKYSNYESLM